MEYNTQLESLRLPEYGRHVHNMIEYCMTLESKEERAKCANTIIDIMGDMFPHLRDVNDFKHILWDHIAIMADFKLDIEYPYEIIKKEDLYSRPKPIGYSRPTMKFRHYGKILEKMIEIAIGMEEGEERQQFLALTAAQMKKSYAHWNMDIDDSKIFIDLFELSDGKLDLRNSNMKLPDTREREPKQQQLQQRDTARRRRKR